jgi:CRP-like cAMP-binding protein
MHYQPGPDGSVVDTGTMSTTRNTSFHSLAGGRPASLPGLHGYPNGTNGSGTTGKTVMYRKGDVIYGPGGPFPGICEVLAGVVRISALTEAGEEVTTDILTRADLFGNLKALPENTTELARALTDSVVCLYDADQFGQLIATDTRAGEWFRNYLMQRWQNLERRFLRINTCKSAENVAFLYKSLNRTVNDAYGREQPILKVITQKDMADLIGATRQTVAAAMRKIRKKNQ